MFASLAGALLAVTFNSLYVFGDSYSDIGAGYLDGNGPTAVAYLAQRLRIPFSYPSAANADSAGLDFAVSAAPTGRHEGEKTGDAIFGTGMVNQVEEFTAQVCSGRLKFDPATTLFFIAGGLNDESFKLSTSTTLRNISWQIRALKRVGARHITLALLPTAIPGFAAVGKRLNPGYEALVPRLRAELGIDIRLNRWGPYFDEILRNPLRYGITDTSTTCAGRAVFGEDTTPCASPQTHFYYHSEHPSTRAHQIVGERLYEELRTPSP